MISTCSLQSGSTGNCIYVETSDAKLLFDAGISAKQARQRLAMHDRCINSVQALLITHNHSDHSRHAGVLHRQISAPIYMTNGSWTACKTKLGVVREFRTFGGGDQLQFGETTVQSILTPHDGKEGVAFVISCQGKKLGIFTDLGHRFDGIEKWLSDLDMLYLESNYDPEMLEDGPYPLWLKRRIIGDGGHLSNLEAAELVRDSAPRLQRLILSHLSEHNNCPELACRLARDVLGDDFPISLAPRSRHSDMFIVQ
jgi:phosphoribosyl 1,2-cyclic phosphodiesterase